MFCRVLVLGLALALIGHASLVPRSIQSDATCSSDFNWAENEQGLSPCLVAAYVNAACSGQEYTVPKLLDQTHYSVIDPNFCTCSWASYNLLSACAACQGQPLSVQTWAFVRDTNCSKFQSPQYFPVNTPIQGDTKIPYWASVDPMTWQNAQFDVDQAETIANQKHADLGTPTASSSSPHSKPPIGAIVGGVVGGLIIIAIGIIGAIYIHNRRVPSIAPQNGFGPRPPLHGRSFSDLSQKSNGTYGQFYPNLATVPGSPVDGPTSPTSPTIRTHNSSQHSLSYYGSAQGSIFSMPLQTVRRVLGGGSSIHGEETSVQANHGQGHVTPFMVQNQGSTSATIVSTPTSPTSMHRKLASESSDPNRGVSRYDDVSVDGHASIMTTGGGARKMNPPAYTPSISDQQTPNNLSGSELSSTNDGNQRGHVRGHAQRPSKASQDSSLSQRSWDSSVGMLSGAGPSGGSNALLARNIAMSLSRGAGTSTPRQASQAYDDNDNPIEIA